MKTIIEFVKREPVRFLTAASLTLAFLVSLGLDLSAEQQALLIGALAAILGVGGETVRANVTPVSKLK